MRRMPLDRAKAPLPREWVVPLLHRCLLKMSSPESEQRPMLRHEEEGFLARPPLDMRIAYVTPTLNSEAQAGPI